MTRAERNTALIADYEAGHPLKHISERYGMGFAQINVLARKARLPKRKGHTGSGRGPQGLNAQKVETIRAMHPHATLRTIGDVVGVSQVSVWKVINGITWSHIA